MLIKPCLLDCAATVRSSHRGIQTRAGIALIDFTVVQVCAALGHRVDDSTASPSKLGRGSTGQHGDVAERIGNNGLEGLSGDGDVIDLLAVEEEVVGSRAGSVDLKCLTVAETAVG